MKTKKASVNQYFCLSVPAISKSVAIAGKSGLAGPSLSLLWSLVAGGPVGARAADSVLWGSVSLRRSPVQVLSQETPSFEVSPWLRASERGTRTATWPVLGIVG